MPLIGVVSTFTVQGSALSSQFHVSSALFGLVAGGRVVYIPDAVEVATPVTAMKCENQRGDNAFANGPRRQQQKPLFDSSLGHGAGASINIHGLLTLAQSPVVHLSDVQL